MVKVGGKSYLLGYYDGLVEAIEMQLLAEQQKEEEFADWFQRNFYACLSSLDQKWMIKFESFMACYRDYDMEVIKRDFSHLYLWYTRQRAYARKNELSAWKVKRFSEAGIELT